MIVARGVVPGFACARVRASERRRSGRGPTLRPPDGPSVARRGRNRAARPDGLDDGLSVGGAGLLAVDGPRPPWSFHHRALGGAPEVDWNEAGVLDQTGDDSLRLR